MRKDLLVVVGGFIGQKKPVADRRQYSLEGLAFNGQINTTFANSSYPVGGYDAVLPLPNGNILVVSATALTFLDANGDYIVGEPNRFITTKGGVQGHLILQPDGKIIVAGSALREVGGTSVNCLARLLPSGLLDTSFQAASITSTANRSIRAVALQKDGKILVGGLFDRVGGVTRYSIARLHPNGALDETFESREVSDVTAIALQADGKILVGEYFSYQTSNPYYQNSQGPMGIKRLHHYVIGPLIQPKFPAAPYNDACLTANMIEAVTNFEQRLGQEGARILKKSSACRAVEYQAHLREIWEHAGALRNASGVRVMSEEPLQFALTFPGVTSASVVEEMNAEILDHWSNSFPPAVARPDPSAPHVRGIAVDWSIEEKKGLDLDALALECGLVRCVPGEKYHFQLSDAPPPVRLVAQGRSPINILVQDPNGRRVGFDAVTGSAVNDLGPAASYSGPGLEPQQIEILPAAMLSGEYRISGVGTGSGAYTIAVQVFSEDDSGDVYEKVLATGIAQVGQPLAPIPSLDCMASVMRLLGWPSGRDLMLVAPGWATNVVLESSPTALPGSWHRVPQTLDARHSLVVTNAGEPARFFRLAKP